MISWHVSLPSAGRVASNGAARLRSPLSSQLRGALKKGRLPPLGRAKPPARVFAGVAPEVQHSPAPIALLPRNFSFRILVERPLPVFSRPAMRSDPYFLPGMSRINPHKPSHSSPSARAMENAMAPATPATSRIRFIVPPWASWAAEPLRVLIPRFGRSCVLHVVSPDCRLKGKDLAAFESRRAWPGAHNRGKQDAGL